jgi:hypothetical protein
VVIKNIAALKAGDQTLDLGPLALQVLLMACFFGFHATGWRVILGVFGPSVTWRAAGRSFFLGSLGRYLPGRVGGLVGRVVVGENEGMLRGQVIAALCYEQAANTVLGFASLVVALVVGGAGLDSFRGSGFIAGAAVVVAGMTILLAPGLLVRLLRATRLLPESDLVEASGPPKGKIVALLAWVLGWVSYGVAGFLLLRAVGLDLGLNQLALVSVVFVGAWAAGFLTFVVPAGLGVREATLCFLLGSVVPGSVAGLVAVLSRLSWILVEMLGVGITIACRRPPKRESG